MTPWRERMLGTPETAAGPALARLLRRGDAGLRARAARALAELGDPEAEPLLLGLLQDPIPALRRAAARGLGRRRSAAEALWARAGVEPCTTVRVELLAAAVRAGVPREEAEARAGEPRELMTARGPRSAEAACGFGPHACRQELGRILGAGQDREALRAELRALIGRDPDGAGRQALEDLAAQGHPADDALLDEALRLSGRRGAHGLLVAFGLCGDPRRLPMLLDQLDRMDVDPGRGFAQRRLAAVAIGRLGLPSAAPRLLRALETEALEHEGRPGAGLGIQFPVRTNLLWALGEIQAKEAAKSLIGYLGNLHGSALGGFYLPAMGALFKLGAVDELQAAALGAGGDAALNAVGVLRALGARAALEVVARGGGPAALAARAD